MAYQPKSYRKFLATGVATAMVATTVAPAVSADQHTDFTDIEDVRSWAGDAIDYLVEKGAIQGMGTPGIFNPQGELTRGQAASLLANTLGLDVDEDATSGFDDLAGHWSDAYVAAIQAELPGVIDGYTDGTFRPENDITRQEMAKITVEAFDLEVNADADVDFEDNNSWGAEYVEVLASLGILGGYTDGTIRPEADITRAEAAVFVHRTEVPSVRLGQDEVAELAVESVSAINATTIEVTFNNGETETFTVDELTPNREAVRTIEYMDEEFEITVTYVVTEQMILRDADGDQIESVSVRANYGTGTDVSVAFVNSTQDAIQTGSVQLRVFDADGNQVDSANATGPLLRADRTTGLISYTVQNLPAGEYELFVAIQEQGSTDGVTRALFTQSFDIVSNPAGIWDEDEDEWVLYATVQDALDAAEDEDTVEMFDDVEEDLVIENDELVLEMNGYTIDGDVTIDAEDVEINGSKITGDVIVKDGANVALGATVTVEGNVVLESATARYTGGDIEGDILRPYLDEDVVQVSSYNQLIQALGDRESYIVLTSDITLADALPVNYDGLTIDLGGYELSGTQDFTVSGDDFTLVNGDVDDLAKIEVNGDNATFEDLEIDSTEFNVAQTSSVENLTVENVEFEGSAIELGNDTDYAVKGATFNNIETDGKVTINGEDDDNNMTEDVVFTNSVFSDDDVFASGNTDFIGEIHVADSTFEDTQADFAGLEFKFEDVTFEDSVTVDGDAEVRFFDSEFEGDVTVSEEGTELHTSLYAGNLTLTENATINGAEFVSNATLDFEDNTVTIMGDVSVAQYRTLTVAGAGGTISGNGATYEGQGTIVLDANDTTLTGSNTFDVPVEMEIATNGLILDNVTFNEVVEVSDGTGNLTIANRRTTMNDEFLVNSALTIDAVRDTSILSSGFEQVATLELNQVRGESITFDGTNALLVRGAHLHETLDTTTLDNDVKFYDVSIDNDVVVADDSVFEDVSWTEDALITVNGELTLMGDITYEDASTLHVAGSLDLDDDVNFEEQDIRITVSASDREFTEGATDEELEFTFETVGFNLIAGAAFTVDSGDELDFEDTAASWSATVAGDSDTATADLLTFSLAATEEIEAGDTVTIEHTGNGLAAVTGSDEDTGEFTFTVAGVERTLSYTIVE